MVRGATERLSAVKNPAPTSAVHPSEAQLRGASAIASGRRWLHQRDHSGGWIQGNMALGGRPAISHSAGMSCDMLTGSEPCPLLAHWPVFLEDPTGGMYADGPGTGP